MEEAYDEIRILRKQLIRDPTNKFIIQEIQYIEEWISKQLKMDSKATQTENTNQQNDVSTNASKPN